MSFEQVKIGGENGTIYQLPEGVSFQTFNWDRTYAVLKDGLNGTFAKGAAVIDSIDIRTIKGHAEQIKAVQELLTRNGAKPIAVPA